MDTSSSTPDHISISKLLMLQYMVTQKFRNASDAIASLKAESQQIKQRYIDIKKKMPRSEASTEFASWATELDAAYKTFLDHLDKIKSANADNERLRTYSFLLDSIVEAVDTGKTSYNSGYGKLLDCTDLERCGIRMFDLGEGKVFKWKR